MGKGGFKELKVWQKSKELAVSVYQVTCSEPFNKDYGLRDQIRRAAVSIPSNIAEGDERETDKEASTTFNDIEMKCLETSRMLSRLIAARSNKKQQKA